MESSFTLATFAKLTGSSLLKLAIELVPSSETGKLPGLKVDAPLAATEAAMDALGSGMGISLRDSLGLLCRRVGIGAVWPGKEDDGDMLVWSGALWLHSWSNCGDEPRMGIGECLASSTSHCENKST